MNCGQLYTEVDSIGRVHQIVKELCSRWPESLLLFRGQNNLHAQVKSGRARPETVFSTAVEAGWTAVAVQMLGLNPDSRQNHGLVKAVLQHYGMVTHYVDLTADIEAACWFASHRFSTTSRSYMFRFYDEAVYGPHNDPGYVIVLAIPNAKNLIAAARLFDLSKLPTSFARPHRQTGWLLLDRPPTEPTPDSFVVATLELRCAAFQSVKTQADLFPPPSQDPAYAAILSLPYLQEPLAYKPNPNLTEDAQGAAFHKDDICVGRRAVSIPEYVEKPFDECVNHKWEDFVIYEPHPMRLWKGWRFLLQAQYPSAKGDIRDTVKVTLSPSAKELLFASDGLPCRWPQLGSDGLLFTFAGWYHDKVADHTPPYLGVWLQRDDDLLFEVPVESDERQMTVTPGHAYFLGNGLVERQQTAHSCPCSTPETHDNRVQAVLRLSALIEQHRLILLPHPTMHSLGWYVVLTGSDTMTERTKADRWRTIVQAVVNK